MASRSIVSSTVESRDRHQAAGLVQTLSFLLFGLSLIETTMLAISRLDPSSRVRLAFIGFGYWMLFPAIVLTGFVARRFGQGAILILLFSLGVGYVLMTRLRGDWVWMGTFDYYLQDRSPWLQACGAGCVLAAIVCLVPTRKPGNPKATGVFLGLYGVSILFSSLASKVWPLESDFALTRHLGDMILLMAMSVLAFIYKDES